MNEKRAIRFKFGTEMDDGPRLHRQRAVFASLWALFHWSFHYSASPLVPNCASITPAFCQSFCMVRRLGPWQQRLRRHSMLLINGIYAASWIYTGQSASPTTRSDQEPNNHYCLTQSVPDAFASLVTSAELTPIRIILGHCTPVLLVCPSTGGEGTAGRDRPGYELSRMIYGHSIWVWRQLNGGRAQNRTAWQTLVETATSLTSSGWWWWFHYSSSL